MFALYLYIFYKAKEIKLEKEIIFVRSEVAKLHRIQNQANMLLGMGICETDVYTCTHVRMCMSGIWHKSAP